MNWTEGQALNETVTEPITREQLAEYAEASGDKNPIHLDDTFAARLGFPSVIVHGMISMAYLADHVRHCFPEKGYFLERMNTRFRRVSFPGDRITCGGQVKKCLPDGNLQVALWAKNPAGEVVADGEATLKTR